MKIALGTAALLLFAYGAYQAAVMVVDKAGAHARFASAVACCTLAMAALVSYFKVRTL